MFYEKRPLQCRRISFILLYLPSLFVSPTYYLNRIQNLTSDNMICNQIASKRKKWLSKDKTLSFDYVKPRSETDIVFPTIEVSLVRLSRGLTYTSIGQTWTTSVSDSFFVLVLCNSKPLLLHRCGSSNMLCLRRYVLLFLGHWSPFLVTVFESLFFPGLGVKRYWRVRTHGYRVEVGEREPCEKG